MKIDLLVPKLTKRVQFTLRYHKFIPREPGCYVLATYDGEVLYVGLTDSLHRRFREHRETKEKCQATPKGIAFWFYYLPCDLKQLERIERTWINTHVECEGERPYFNKVESPVH